MLIFFHILCYVSTAAAFTFASNICLCVCIGGCWMQTQTRPQWKRSISEGMSFLPRITIILGIFWKDLKKYPKEAEGVVRMFYKNDRYKILLYVSKHSKHTKLNTNTKNQTSSKFFKLFHFCTIFDTLEIKY